MAGGVLDLVRPEWPPLRHVRAGWDALTVDEQETVRTRTTDVLGQVTFAPDAPKEALLRFFAFLAQVETIAIEIPMRFLPHARADLRPALRRQLVDEVFHSTVFSRLAHDLAYPAAQPPPPLRSAERLLGQIRAQEDLALTATLLNLAAEGWIETLFRHARRWGVADPVFQAVLEDEARHVHEATDYAEDLDMEAARTALHALEQGLMQVGSEPMVAMPMMRLAGQANYEKLLQDLHRSHVRHLAQVGLTPSQEWLDATKLAEQMAADAHATQPATVMEDTPWRVVARNVWTTPRDPTMQGAFDVPVGHVPKRLLTPVFIAAVGRAWARNPDLNVVLAQDRIWRLPRVQVGVRVQVAPGQLATVLVPDADTCSIRDVQRHLADGMARLEALRDWAEKQSQQAPAAAAQTVEDGRRIEAPQEWDHAMGQWLPPTDARYAVSVSNVGKFGLETGSGAFTAGLSPTTDLTMGRRARKPRWKGLAFVPSWTLPVGALQDHRVFDGDHAGRAMQAIQAEMRPQAVRTLLAAPDTLPSDRPDPVYDEAWVRSLPEPLQAMPAMMVLKVDPVYAVGAAAMIAAGAAGYAVYRATQKERDGADSSAEVRWHCPRCRRLYRVPRMPKEGTVCPQCRNGGSR